MEKKNEGIQPLDSWIMAIFQSVGMQRRNLSHNSSSSLKREMFSSLGRKDRLQAQRGQRHDEEYAVRLMSKVASTAVPQVRHWWCAEKSSAQHESTDFLPHKIFASLEKNPEVLQAKSVNWCGACEHRVKRTEVGNKVLMTEIQEFCCEPSGSTENAISNLASKVLLYHTRRDKQTKKWGHNPYGA